ncbi:MAG: SRPBCC family protein [Candidatus Omnitrophota bacterium]
MHKIQIQRILRAKPWRVMRKVLSIEELPSYFPSAKSVHVLERSPHGFKTEWHVEFDGIPVRWVEESTVDFSARCITFRSSQGDLGAFQGSWNFRPHPDGTEVTVAMDLEVGLPILGGDVLEGLLLKIKKNFVFMLEAVQNRLVSEQYRTFQKRGHSKVEGFALIGHPYNISNLIHHLQVMNPTREPPSEDFLRKVYEMMPPYVMYDIKEFISASQARSRGLIIVSTFIPDMAAKDPRRVFDKVIEACRVAEEHCIGVAALGGFTSIVGEQFGEEMRKRVHIPLTTGNTLTVSMAIEGVRKACAVLDVDLNTATACIIGGTGDIGSGCARILAEEVRNLIITGRDPQKVDATVAEMQSYGKAFVTGTLDNRKAVATADIVIAAASVTSSILEADAFKPGTIICDLAYPKNISYAYGEREDLLIFSGGLVHIPQDLHFGFEIGLPAPDTIYACFAESILLGLEKRYESFSYGRGYITRARVEEINRIAFRHGFQVAPFYAGNRQLTEKNFETIKQLSQGRING